MSNPENNLVIQDDKLKNKLLQSINLKSQLSSYSSLPENQWEEIKKSYLLQVYYQSFLENPSDYSIEDLYNLIELDKVNGKRPFSEYLKEYKKLKTLIYIEEESKKAEAKLTVSFIQKLYLQLNWGEDIFKDDSYALPYRDSLALMDQDSPGFMLPSISDIHFQLEKLIEEFYESKEDNLLLFIVNFQYQFMMISPFQRGNLEISFYLVQFLLLLSSFPMTIFRRDEKERYTELLSEDISEDFAIYHSFMDELIYSLEHQLSMLGQMKNKNSISAPGYFTSLIKEIQSVEKEVTSFTLQKTVDTEAVSDTLTEIENLLELYFTNYPFEEIKIDYKRISVKDILFAHQIREKFRFNINRPLWKTEEDEEQNNRYFVDLVPSVIEVELKSNLLYVPDSYIYFGIMPTREGNYIYSAFLSTYLDFKKEERFPNQIGFFREVKGGVGIENWDRKVISKFIDGGLREFFDQLSEKVNERKRILKKAY